MRPKVGVIGLGYVGLPLSIEISRAGFTVVGVDIDPRKVGRINAGFSDIVDVSNLDIQQQILSGNFLASTSFEELKEVEIVVVCVPTPLNENRSPDYSFVQNAAQAIAPWINKGDLIILESSVAPGTTRELFLPILESISGLNQNNFYLAFSPERVDPGNIIWQLKNTPKIVAGLNDESLRKAVDFYSTFVQQLVPCESLEIAEMAKILENSFRFINISFINEVKVLADKLKIDLIKVIDAAGTKPYGFMKFYPSLGAGGHCIPVDPKFLTEIASKINTPLRFLNLAEDINVNLPNHFVSLIDKKLGGLINKRILIIGIAYKANVADLREAPALTLINELRSEQAKVFWHDDLVMEWNSEKSSPLSGEYDLAILATAHDYLELSSLRNVPILNTQGFIH